MPGGAFFRGFDGVTYYDAGPQFAGDYRNKTSPATLCPFRLDRFEVTVGRFRRFVDAVVGGWRPEQGAGKHVHVNGGRGLAKSEGFEEGWQRAWNRYLLITRSDWKQLLQVSCRTSGPFTFTDSTSDDAHPINCVSWHQAYAFCIWDGGFLPSDAEWNFAATGGDEQRVYPWSIPPDSATIGCDRANYDGCGDSINFVGRNSGGDGRFQHADLAGNLNEWTLDAVGPYPMPCTDCFLSDDGSSATPLRWTRGGGFRDVKEALLASDRNGAEANGIGASLGFRCARAPGDR